MTGIKIAVRCKPTCSVICYVLLEVITQALNNTHYIENPLQYLKKKKRECSEECLSF